MTDDWLREIDNKTFVGSVLSDFSVAFDIFDHNLLLEKHICYGVTSLLYCGSSVTCLTEHPGGCSLMEAYPT